MENADRNPKTSKRNRAARRTPVALIPFVAILLFAVSPAFGLHFADGDRVFLETFAGELAYPTTPELDKLGFGGLGTLPSVSPTLTGTVAHASLVLPGPTDRRVHAANGAAVGNASFGVSVGFENLVHHSEGVAASAIGASFDTALGFGISLLLDVVRNDSLGDEATIEIFEFDSVSPPSILTVLALPDVAVAAIRSGDPYVLDLYVDRANDVVVGSVRVEGVGTFTTDPAFFTPLSGESAVDISQGFLVSESLTPFSSEVDMTSFSIYDDLRPLVLAFYVDVGAANGTPANTYGAVIPVGGEWNTIGLGTTGLVEVTTTPSGVGATLTTTFDNGAGPGAPADAQALMGDDAGDCTTREWTLSFSNLAPGYYVIYVYVPSRADTSSGTISIPQGGNLPDMPGNVGAALLPGVSFGQTHAVVTDGSLDLQGLGDGAAACGGIAGVQLLPRLDPVVAAPGLGWVGAGVLATLLWAVGAWVVVASTSAGIGSSSGVLRTADTRRSDK